MVVNYASDQKGADSVVAAIAAKGGKAFAVKADVAKQADVRRLFEEAKETFDRIDILVNNAGVYQFQPIEEITEDDFHRLFNTNVLGTLLTTKEAAKHFGSNGGRTTEINISSVAGETATPTGIGLFGEQGRGRHALACAPARRIRRLARFRVNVIAPGGVETEGATPPASSAATSRNQCVPKTALGRLGQPDDIAPGRGVSRLRRFRLAHGERVVASGGYF